MDIKEKLQEPFKPEEIEWRVQSCGVRNDKPWVMVLAYVQARAIQTRLDDVFGWDGWQDEYRAMGQNVICRLSVKTEHGWISKENGASETNVEAFKGGISGAFKRVAASGYGIGRYLYSLEESFAECQLNKPSNMKGWNFTKTKDKKTNIYWKEPSLPSWALPKGSQQEKNKPQSSRNNVTSINSRAENKNPSQGEIDPDNLFCIDCEKQITQGVYTFSMSKFNKPLCFNCQK